MKKSVVRLPPPAKPRDPNWKVLAGRKGGAHGRTEKAERRRMKVILAKGGAGGGNAPFAIERDKERAAC